MHLANLLASAMSAIRAGRRGMIGISLAFLVPKHFSSLWLCFGLRFLTGGLMTDASGACSAISILSARRQRGG